MVPKDSIYERDVINWLWKPLETNASGEKMAFLLISLENHLIIVFFQ